MSVALSRLVRILSWNQKRTREFLIRVYCVVQVSQPMQCTGHSSCGQSDLHLVLKVMGWGFSPVSISVRVSRRTRSPLWHIYRRSVAGPSSLRYTVLQESQSIQVFYYILHIPRNHDDWRLVSLRISLWAAELNTFYRTFIWWKMIPNDQANNICIGVLLLKDKL